MLSGVSRGVSSGVSRGVLSGVASGVSRGVLSGVASGVSRGVLSGVPSGVSVLIGVSLCYSDSESIGSPGTSHADKTDKIISAAIKIHKILFITLSLICFCILYRV